MVIFTLVSIENTDTAQLIERWASPQDHAAASLKKSTKRQEEYLIGRASMYALLQSFTGKSNWQILVDAKGKPYVTSSDGQPGPSISLSHTHGLIACAATTDHMIGIDVEYWRPRNYVEIATYFGSHEQEAVAHGDASAFYRIWTLREAIAKAQGTTIFRLLDKVDYCTEMSRSEPWCDGDWNFLSYIPAENYSLSLAVHGPRTEPAPISFRHVMLQSV